MTLRHACSAFTTREVFDTLDCSCRVTDEDGDVVDRAIEAASDILTILSGYRITGLCVRTVRPITNMPCWPLHGLVGNIDMRDAGAARFGGLRTIPMPGPNTNILEVVVDGIALDEDAYGILDGSFLYRKVGEWPTVNDLRLPSTEVGTFEVTVRFGEESDFITEAAACELTCELTKSWLGQKSTLPPGITSANIQGASVGVDAAARDKPSTLPATVRFLSTYAPDGPNVSGVWSPELTQGWDLVEIQQA